MGKIKVLNLYAGIGGNRKLWENVEVTAVENNQEIADIYKHFFPQDKVIVADAHQYLLDHFKEFDFIWSSPPCPTHSRMGYLAMKNTGERGGGTKKMKYPDMRLYQEIILLESFCNSKWVVENTKSYYNPLIKPYISGSHFFWSNFHINNFKTSSRAVSVSTIAEKEKKLGFCLDGYSLKTVGSHRKDKVLNNCVDPKLSLHIFNCAFKNKQSTLTSIPPAPKEAGILEGVL